MCDAKGGGREGKKLASKGPLHKSRGGRAGEGLTISLRVRVC